MDRQRVERDRLQDRAQDRCWRHLRPDRHVGAASPPTTIPAYVWNNLRLSSARDERRGRFAYSAEASATTLAPPSFRAAASAGSASGVLTLTINKPTGTQQGDVMVASIAMRPETAAHHRHGMDARPPSSTTRAATRILSPSTTKWQARANRRATRWTFGTSTGAAGGIASFSGVDTANPIDVEAGQNTSNGLNLTAPSVTTRFVNAMIVTSHAFSSRATFTSPTGMTEAVDRASGSVPDSSGESIQVNYRLQASVGATGTKTATASNDADVGNAHTLALRAR